MPCSLGSAPAHFVHMSIPSRRVADSALKDQVYMIFPNDLNAHETVFGGLVMAQMDRYAVVVANRHAASTCVTASVDAVHFMAPARRGDVLHFSAAVNRTWRTSMEIGVKVEAIAHQGGERRHIVSAYFTFVSLDEHGRARAVPEIVPETATEHHRYEEAALRRAARLRHAEELKTLRAERYAES